MPRISKRRWVKSPSLNLSLFCVSHRSRILASSEDHFLVGVIYSNLPRALINYIATFLKHTDIIDDDQNYQKDVCKLPFEDEEVANGFHTEEVEQERNSAQIFCEHILEGL